MCGICGKFAGRDVTQSEMTRMTDAIAHRGPDDEGFFIDGQVGLGARRLSIIDLDGGSQPMSNEDGSLWIVFNGEIYNYLDLRARLERAGHVFSTESDTEVILHLYEDRGPNCLEQLRGMFAFAIWDGHNRELFLARDRLGQKPLFYSHYAGDFQFASEIKSLLANPNLPREIDYESIYHYLSLRFIPAPRTMFEHIQKLPPAHYLIYRDGSVHVSQYWELSFEEKLEINADELLEGLGDKLNEAVASHLISDVPVGAFLSGGMDSSMVVAMMARSMALKPSTFAIGVNEQVFNELPYARTVAGHVGTRHYEELVKSNLIRLLPEMIWHLDEPSDPIAACMYHAAELASRHVKVVLGGDGGDELFAGFDRYRGLHYSGLYSLVPRWIRDKVIGPALSFIPESFSYKSWTQRVRWFHQVASSGGKGAQYAAATSFFRFNEREKRELFQDELWRELKSLNSAELMVDIFERAPADSLTDRMLYTDFVTRLPEHSLMLTDRMTMAHSLEARSPFLDHELVEYVAKFPSNLKIRNGELKSILRQLAKSYLPESIVERKKQGFMFPVAYWFRGELYDFLRATLLNSTFIKEGVFRRDYIERLIEEHHKSQVDHHVRLWMLLNLELWYQLYLGDRSPHAISEEIRERVAIPSNGDSMYSPVVKSGQSILIE